MLVIALIKGVPANTANVVSIGGILRREEMDIVLNPYDRKTLEAADYLRRRVGGKLIALSMGPHPKIIPIMNELFQFEVEGIDEAVIVSDRKLAGSDTLATSYVLAKAIVKILKTHREAVEGVRRLIEEGKSPEEVLGFAERLYGENLLPNIVYNDKPSISKDSIVVKLAEGSIDRDQAIAMLKKVEEKIYRDFTIFAGMKASDGETGNVGPQVAEALGEELNTTIPQATFVLDYEYSSENNTLIVKRKLLKYIQVLKVDIPAVLTIHQNYRAPSISLAGRKSARLWMYRGKSTDIKIWNATDIEAKPNRIGLPGSPTVVGPGVDIGKPKTLKIVGRSIVAIKDIGEITYNGRKLGPFKAGDVIDNVPQDILNDLMNKGLAKVFSYEDLVDELIKELKT